MLVLKNIKAFIFDLDGVITDTSELHESAWRKLAQEENIPFDGKWKDQLRGISRRESLDLILKNSPKSYTENEIQYMLERKNNYYNNNLESLTPKNILPGVNELLELLKSENYKIAVASASKNALKVLTKLKLINSFDVITSGNELTHSKPDPEIFLLTAKKLGLLAQSCIVVEDAPAGIEAANNGGFFSIAIGPASRFVSLNKVNNLQFNNILELIKYLIPLLSY